MQPPKDKPKDKPSIPQPDPSLIKKTSWNKIHENEHDLEWSRIVKREGHASEESDDTKRGQSSSDDE